MISAIAVRPLVTGAAGIDHIRGRIETRNRAHLRAPADSSSNVDVGVAGALQLGTVQAYQALRNDAVERGAKLYGSTSM